MAFLLRKSSKKLPPPPPLPPATKVEQFSMKNKLDQGKVIFGFHTSLNKFKVHSHLCEFLCFKM
jgi:hypothetical protein